MKLTTKQIILRLAISMVIASVFGWVVSETSFNLTNADERQEPAEFDLVIPAGTAEKVERGEIISEIPTTMKFLEGDVLLVHNEDSVDHQLGPIWVPPGTTGVLRLEKPSSYNYACSFQATKIFGLDVEQRVTTWIRLQGILAIALPTGVLLWLYSLVIDSPKKDPSGAGA
ncbi:MAG: hypothetical protein GYA17_01855 [Chloroflexi bacterium]|jgi:hypothetical protein|nr:hypothetical protein [Anaerolineaceae bacterium]NMB87072.1 hypothetical protein [Chloroflexota bacterium]